jgi:hypothetical protein
MPPKLRRLLYDHFWWGAPVVFVTCLYALHRLFPAFAMSVALPLAGGLAGAYYFLQKHQLEELRLFEEMFATFNRRYAELNSRLQHLVAGSAPLSKEDRALLEDYFNLCAEEYFYYRRGIIDPVVWRAWCRGMLQYLHDERIADFWRHEESTDSYYGLTLKTILAGSRGRRLPEEMEPADESRSQSRRAA